MSELHKINDKIISLEELKARIESWKANGEKIAFTNGCFDILHRGHVEVLAKTVDLGDKLIIGLNSDSSIKKLKEENRPIVDEKSRALLLAAFSFVDAIVLFSEQTPINLIAEIKPDILVKGGDYEIQEIVGYNIVQGNGGEVITIPLTEGFSSTNIIDKIQND
ncbi:MAG: D-glycero-beta-D-manno-heptose 1-phosphate adenylyltransferase [Flavobacteriales bacterium]|jgi:rfaE bifunctional protein nucleotidyltransferase chain/domain|nr:D-glycero-beta-D-manno-heptose 1-phosphate adenylyltransferase [Flavobacteriales bacterium]HJN63298.1 D-glycero-beta-D-manno-heptose 1-phosphate adenylyltransferase [Flavobacteriales bacterium]|tara:strand:+ start:5871 stop:6362 length:492 start_codon:yes stop_codon:yes gene_type:complete